MLIQIFDLIKNRMRQQIWALFLIIGILFGACTSQADLVIRNAKVLTVDSEFSQTEAVAIRDGIFIAVGTNDEVQDYISGGTRVIDASGKTVIPGLIESHSHATDVVRREYATPYPFEQLESISDIQRWLSEQVEQTDEGQWILLPRTDVTRIQEGRIPTPNELTEVAPNHPAVFNWQFANRQIQVLNTAAVEAAGITSETEAQDGGKIELQDGGAVLENAGVLTEEYLPSREIPIDKYHNDLVRLFKQYNEVGITSVFERGSDVAGFSTYQKLREQGRLPVRAAVTIYLNSDGTVEDTEQAIQDLPVAPDDGNDWVKVGPLKIRVDGGILYGSAYMREPYSADAISFYGFDNPSHHGALLINPEHIKNMIHTGQRMGWQMSAHVTGDAGVDAVLDAVEASNADHPNKQRRFNLIHAYFVHPETAERAAQLGIGVDTQPAWYYMDGDALSNVLRTDLMEKFIGVHEWQQAGVPVAINTDHMYGFDPNTSLNPYNPFLTMYMVISRKTAGGQVIDSAQKVSRKDALRMMTTNAAWLSFDEDKKGSIEVGKLADLAILSDDLMTVEEEQIKDIRSVLTVVGGKVVYESEQ